MKEYYSVLQVDENASTDDIKRQYKKLAMKFHPDKNTSETAEQDFKKIGEAYATLSDPEKRRQYDCGGQQQIPFDFSPDQLFQQFFNMHNGFNVHMNGGAFNFMFQEQPIVFTIEVSLGDLYNRVKKTFNVEVSVQGGKKVSTVEVQLEPTHVHGDQVRFAGMGNATHPQAKPGDIICIIHVANHTLFQRDGNNLHHLHEITLKQALLGFSFTLDTLDARQLNVLVKDTIISPETEHVVAGEGMTRQGNLILHFSIKFPEGPWDSETREKLENIL
jgi:DnaJ homolog subfamily B member 4